jgi:hypothetical protein
MGLLFEAEVSEFGKCFDTLINGKFVKAADPATSNFRFHVFLLSINVRSLVEEEM